MRLLAPKVSKMKPKSKRPAKLKKEAKREDRRVRSARVREEVFSRAWRHDRHQCEAQHPDGGNTDADGAEGFKRCEGTAEILDHWLGGVGRRRTSESWQTCWALCRKCNADRTANHPSAEYWNVVHQAHCARYGFAWKPHITRERFEALRRPAEPSPT